MCQRGEAYGQSAWPCDDVLRAHAAFVRSESAIIAFRCAGIPAGDLTEEQKHAIRQQPAANPSW